MSIHKLVIKGRYIDPVNGENTASICIDDDYISDIIHNGYGKEIIELSDSVLIFPGFVDTHVHLREDEGGKWNYKEDFIHGTKAALNGGVTTVFNMPNTQHPAINRKSIEEKCRLAWTDKIDIYPIAGVIRDNIKTLREMADIIVAYKIYVSETTGELKLDDYELIEQATGDIALIGKPVIEHCEDQKILDENKKYFSEGYPATKHHLARPEECEITSAEICADIAYRTKAKTVFAHASLPETVEIAQKYNTRGANIKIEATPHHLFFTSDDVKDYFLKVNPPIRSQESRDMLWEHLRKGWIDFIGSDHAPHTINDKLKGPSGMPGLDTYGNFIGWAIKKVSLDPQTAARITSYNAAQFFGLEKVGRIEEGYIANLAIIDLEREESHRKLYTKCAWSSFEGVSMPVVTHTIYHGKIMKKDGKLLV